MKLAISLAIIAGLFSVSTAQAALTAWQQNMTHCNQQANPQTLKGEPRKSCMSSCLKGEMAATTGMSKSGKPLTIQQ